MVEGINGTLKESWLEGSRQGENPFKKKVLKTWLNMWRCPWLVCRLTNVSGYLELIRISTLQRNMEILEKEDQLSSSLKKKMIIFYPFSFWLLLGFPFKKAHTSRNINAFMLPAWNHAGQG